MPFIELSMDDQQTLLSLARESIRVRLLFERDLCIDETAFSPALQQQAASFITLHKKDKLRGCIGSDQASKPLVTDVVHHAMASAFDDPRFPAVTLDEESTLQIKISVLTTPVPLSFASEQELLDQLAPNEDGLTIEMGAHRATFLPTAWNRLPGKIEFLEQLKLKAELPPGFWSDDIKAWQHHTLCFQEAAFRNK
ncbi:MAG: AmmeMemoRadiSam system protein A [Porticoccus sp.]|nr:AmmeMemoRadiSam system protein A [Porticoccus sp.]PCJ93773.1 MAG: AMMECR1 domain-containing protein [Porticoccaceae bacterium]